MKHEVYAIIKETELAKGQYASELLRIFDGEDADKKAEAEMQRLRMEETENGTETSNAPDPPMPRFQYLLFGWDSEPKAKVIWLYSSEYYLPKEKK